MAKKELLLGLLAEAVKRENEFVDGLSSADHDAAGAADNWSAKDVISHCAYWKKVRAAEIPQALAGESPTDIENFDHENDMIFQENKDKSWDEVLAFSREASHLLISQVQQMSEEDLEWPFQEERPIWRMVVGNGYSHPTAHLAGHYRQKGDLEKAAELTSLLGQPLAALDDSPDWQGTVKYNAACSLSLLGQKEAAIAELRDALALTPALVEWSQKDSDLEPLHEEEAYKALYQ